MWFYSISIKIKNIIILNISFMSTWFGGGGDWGYRCICFLWQLVHVVDCHERKYQTANKNYTLKDFDIGNVDYRHNKY